MTRELLTVVASSIVLGSGWEVAFAQDHPTSPRGELIAYAVQSGERTNAATSTQLVFSQLIHAPNAAWMRLYFSHLVLEGRSVIRMTSLADGEVQELDATGVMQWGFSSAYLNGDSVMLELVAAPGTSRNAVGIDQIAIEFLGGEPQPVGGTGQCGICGLDDRVPSNVSWAARLMPAGCTASVFNTCSTMVSAGHCMSSGMVVQFNVPNSLPNCALVSPPVADQFPITNYSYSAVDIGNDWAVLKSGANSLGQKPFERYGALMPIATSAAAVGNAVGLWGYGMDTNCINNQRQQTSTGNVNVVSSTYFQFSADLRAGNSGTAIIRNGQIIGIATNCMVGCPNVASAMSIPAFVNARATLGTCQLVPCPADVTGDSAVNVSDLLQVIQHWGSCPPWPTVCVGDVVPLPPIGVNTQDLLAVVNAWGNCP